MAPCRNSLVIQYTIKQYARGPYARPLCLANYMSNLDLSKQNSSDTTFLLNVCQHVDTRAMQIYALDPHRNTIPVSEGCVASHSFGVALIIYGIVLHWFWIGFIVFLVSFYKAGVRLWLLINMVLVLLWCGLVCLAWLW